MSEKEQEEGLRKKKIEITISQLLAEGIIIKTGEDLTVIVKDNESDVSA